MAIIRRKSRESKKKSEAPPKRRFRFLLWAFRISFWSSLAFAALVAYAWISLGGEKAFRVPTREPGILLLADDGTSLAERGAFFGDEVRLDELPEYVPNAVIAVEDRRFRLHFGADPIGLARAFYNNFRAGRVVEGGSTLTQQLAKNLFLQQERTYSRKLQELVLALWLEWRFTKDEILQLYLNRVYFGGGAIGIEKAAQNFFGHSASQLTLSEAASLAAVLKAPSRLNPEANPKANAERAAEVINDMLEAGFISELDAKTAIISPAQTRPPEGASATQYIVDWILEQLPELIGKYDQSIIVETTIDLSLQKAAEKAVRQHLANEGKKLKASQSAVVLIDPQGRLRAMVGGRSYQKSQFNRAAKARRQPGSSFKPFVYLTALERGFTPMSIEMDAPLQLGKWRPENYKKQYLGEVSLNEALVQSINTVAVRLALKLGPENIVATAKRLGIASPLEANPSLALGTSAVTPLEMATAYSAFANGGSGVVTHVVKRISLRDGTLLYERHGSGIGQVIDYQSMGSMNFMLRQVIERGTGHQARIAGLDVAGKTGTTQDYRDAWFIGYSPQFICAVWVGNDDNSSMKRVTGGGLPSLIWRDIMLEAHKNKPASPLPGEAPAPPVAEFRSSVPQIMNMFRRAFEAPADFLRRWAN